MTDPPETPEPEPPEQPDDEPENDPDPYIRRSAIEQLTGPEDEDD